MSDTPKNPLNSSDISWIEAISVLEHLRAGQTAGAVDVVTSAALPHHVLYSSFRLLSMWMRLCEPEDVEAFFETSYRVGPPPPIHDHPSFKQFPD